MMRGSPLLSTSDNMNIIDLVTCREKWGKGVCAIKTPKVDFSKVLYLDPKVDTFSIPAQILAAAKSVQVHYGQNRCSLRHMRATASRWAGMT